MLAYALLFGACKHGVVVVSEQRLLQQQHISGGNSSLLTAAAVSRVGLGHQAYKKQMLARSKQQQNLHGCHFSCNPSPRALCPLQLKHERSKLGLHNADDPQDVHLSNHASDGERAESLQQERRWQLWRLSSQPGWLSAIAGCVLITGSLTGWQLCWRRPAVGSACSGISQLC